MCQKNKAIFLTVILIFSVFLFGCKRGSENDQTKYPMTVSYLDVGQGDGILIECEDAVVFIDGGESTSVVSVSEYLKRKKIRTIDYYIVTHPHTDHIGAVAALLSLFDVEHFVMGEFSELNMPTTKTFEKMINAVAAEGCEVIFPHCGDEFEFAELKAEFFAPVEETDNYNNMSLVFRLTYDNTSFLFVGDAEKESEELILASGADIKADVLKVGHHGSSSSSSPAFVNAVSPDFAVISCGKNNDYGHPHDVTLKTFKDYGAKVFRTDKDGTVVLYSDGNKVITE